MSITRIKKFLYARDEFRCGIHLGGCKEIIDMKDITIDHIVPKAYWKKRKVHDKVWSGSWNLQVMHKLCNEHKFIDFREFEFDCDCHEIEIIEDVRYISYYRDHAVNVYKDIPRFYLMALDMEDIDENECT